MWDLEFCRYWLIFGISICQCSDHTLWKIPFLISGQDLYVVEVKDTFFGTNYTQYGSIVKPNAKMFRSIDVHLYGAEAAQGHLKTQFC